MGVSYSKVLEMTSNVLLALVTATSTGMVGFQKQLIMIHRSLAEFTNQKGMGFHYNTG